jgi:hypothetical protein
MKSFFLVTSLLFLFVLSAEAQTPAKPKKTTATTTTTTKPVVSVSNKANNAINGANGAVNGANNAVNVANNKMNNAASSVNGTYNRVNNTRNKITGFLNKGNDTTANAQASVLPPPPPGPPGKPSDTLMQNLKKLGSLFKKPRISVVIKVPGANRAKLKELCELIKTCPNVDKKNVDFDDAQQNITVNSYKGKLDNLLSDIQKKNPLVTSTNSSSLPADNSITINLQ